MASDLMSVTASCHDASSDVSMIRRASVFSGCHAGGFPASKDRVAAFQK
jgi:hypothetical protein